MLNQTVLEQEMASCTSTPRAEMKCHATSGPPAPPLPILSLHWAWKNLQESLRFSQTFWETIIMADKFKYSAADTSHCADALWGLLKLLGLSCPLFLSQCPSQSVSLRNSLISTGDGRCVGRERHLPAVSSVFPSPGPLASRMVPPLCVSAACVGGCGRSPELLWVLGLYPLPLWDPEF